ncbi:unnamed protein product, partial [Nesidiocoris tenuis]
MATGVSDSNLDITCEVCAMGKQARLPFKPSKHRAKDPLELVHMDLCGPMETESLGGSRYFLAIIGDHTRYTFVYFMKTS